MKYDWNVLEEIDFKVYNGEPKIQLKAPNAEYKRNSSYHSKSMNS
jgi:hypothetical protein